MCCVVLGRADVSVLRAGLLSIYSHPRHANKMAPGPCILYSTKPHVLSAGFPLVRAAEWFFLCAHHLILSKGAGWQQNLNRIKLSQATHFLTLNPSKFLFCTSFTKLLCLPPHPCKDFHPCLARLWRGPRGQKGCKRQLQTGAASCYGGSTSPRGTTGHLAARTLEGSG